VERELFFIAVDERETFRDIAIKEGFTEAFVDRTLLQEFYECRRDPKLPIQGDCSRRILRREPEDLRAWLLRVGHIFVG